MMILYAESFDYVRRIMLNLQPANGGWFWACCLDPNSANQYHVWLAELNY